MCQKVHHIFILILAPPGWCMTISAWSPPFDAYLCNDVATQEAIEGGRDIYREGTIETFGRYSDPLKKVFKAVKLSLSYGKDPTTCTRSPIS